MNDELLQRLQQIEKASANLNAEVKRVLNANATYNFTKIQLLTSHVYTAYDQLLHVENSEEIAKYDSYKGN